MTKLNIEKDTIVGATDVARELGTHPSWVYRLISAGKLHPITPYRGRPIFDRREVVKLKKQNANKNN